jgi:hypothetical protein
VRTYQKVKYYFSNSFFKKSLLKTPLMMVPYKELLLKLIFSNDFDKETIGKGWYLKFGSDRK